MVIKEALEDACGKNDGVLGRGVEGVDDSHQVEGAPVRLVHGLPQLRVLIPSIPSCQSLLNKMGINYNILLIRVTAKLGCI